MDRGALLTTPNLLSLSRVLLAAVFVLAPASGVRLAVLCLAALTDLLDGWLARRLNRTSRAGALLDPIADRLFVLAALLALLVDGVFTARQAVLFLTRDLATALGFLVARLTRSLRPVAFQARGAGKVVTGLQFATLLAALVRPTLVPVLVPLVALAGAVAIADYTHALWRARAS